MNDIIRNIKECLIKAELPCWYVNEDTDVDSDIYFDAEDVLHVKRVKTVFKSSDVERISYRNYEANDSFYEEYYDESNYVKIMFVDKSAIFLCEYGTINYQSKEGDYYPISRMAFDALRIGGYDLNLKLSDNQMTIRDCSLEKYNGNKESVTIPEGVKEIGPRAFCGKNIKNVIFPSTLLRVGIESFASCKELNKVEFNDGLRIIDISAFIGCKMLKEIKIPNALESIGDNAFGYSGITNIEKEDDVSIGKIESSFVATPYLDEIAG